MERAECVLSSLCALFICLLFVPFIPLCCCCVVFVPGSFVLPSLRSVHYNEPVTKDTTGTKNPWLTAAVWGMNRSETNEESMRSLLSLITLHFFSLRSCFSHCNSSQTFETEERNSQWEGKWMSGTGWIMCSFLSFLFFPHSIRALYLQWNGKRERKGRTESRRTEVNVRKGKKIRKEN